MEIRGQLAQVVLSFHRVAPWDQTMSLGLVTGVFTHEAILPTSLFVCEIVSHVV